MEIYLHNTLSGKKELFKPLKKTIFGTPKVGMYHCGPTVYWDQTIGNMRAMVMADLVRRTFTYGGYKVSLIRNYTDVGHLTGDNIGDADSGEDRMEKAARREQLSPDQIADKYIHNFIVDTASLNVLPPTETPRATHFIKDMIAMVQDLVDKGFAYSTPHAIYFDVQKFPDYTKLSGQKLLNLESGQGHGTVGDLSKKSPQDFALWFFKAGVHTNALQTWKSPFSSPLVKDGEGFPGWHIECSAMSKHFLGKTLDIHMGGIEHVPIHHTNEIAQSECANGQHYVNYWLHNEHLLVDNKKMGKSEGNAYLIRDIVAKGYSPIALRYFFLQSNYRSKQNFTWESLGASQTALKNLEKIVASTAHTGKISLDYKKRFQEAISDDFNLAGGLAVLWDLAKSSDISDEDRKATILDFDKVLGLNLSSVPLKVQDSAIPAEIQKLADARVAARTAKDWKASDTLRLEIESLGYEVKDTPEGQKVIKK